MRKVMTKKQRAKRVNDIKILVYYSIAKIAQLMTLAGIAMFLIAYAADIEFSPISTIIMYLVAAAIIVIVSNFIASRLSRYLYDKKAISASRVIDSIFYH